LDGIEIDFDLTIDHPVHRLPLHPCGLLCA
jgi:hypothetical protein